MLSSPLTLRTNLQKKTPIAHKINQKQKLIKLTFVVFSPYITPHTCCVIIYILFIIYCPYTSPHAFLFSSRLLLLHLQYPTMHSYPSIQIIPASTGVSGALDPQAPEYWPAPVQYVQHMDDQPLIPYHHDYPFYYSPYPYMPNCCYEKYSSDFQPSSMSIYHNNMFIYLGSSPMELQATMPSYYASPPPSPGNYNYPFCAPLQLPFSTQVAPSIEDKPRGKETKKVARAGSKYKKRMERLNSTWVGKEEGCSSARRCVSLNGAESVLVKEGKTTVMVKNIPNKYT